MLGMLGAHRAVERTVERREHPPLGEIKRRRLAVPRARILHVAQSLFHDHVPARELGLASVWIDRRRGRAGSGATPEAVATPDAAVASMAEFADLALG